MAGTNVAASGNGGIGFLFNNGGAANTLQYSNGTISTSATSFSVEGAHRQHKSRQHDSDCEQQHTAQHEHAEHDIQRASVDLARRHLDKRQPAR